MEEENKQPLIAISVFEDVLIDINKISDLKKQLSILLNTKIENISIEVGYD